MITLTRLDGSDLILNADLIEFVEPKPDTYISLITGKRLVVRETPNQVIDRVVAYRREAGRHLTPPVVALPARDADED